MISCMQCCGCIPKSNLPSNVIPLSESEHQTVHDALQGSFQIKGIAMSKDMQKLGGGNAYVTPIQYDSAVVWSPA